MLSYFKKLNYKTKLNKNWLGHSRVCGRKVCKFFKILETKFVIIRFVRVQQGKYEPFW